MADLERIARRQRAEQWHLDDVDWSRPLAAPLGAAEEAAVVRYFSDMVVIERLAGDLFEVQRRQLVDQPRLDGLLAGFVRDEARHARVMARLARRFDTRGRGVPPPDRRLLRFAPRLVAWVETMPRDVGATAVTCGELILDVALLRPLEDLLDDPTLAQAMALVNRDESRHIAVDFHLLERYGSEAYLAERAAAPRPSPAAIARSAWRLLAAAGAALPFLRGVYFGSMRVVDAEGARLRDAMKRIQLLASRRGFDQRPFARILRGVTALFDHPLARTTLGPAAGLVLGVDPAVLGRLYDESERKRARAASMDALAADAIRAFAGVGAASEA